MDVYPDKDFVEGLRAKMALFLAYCQNEFFTTLWNFLEFSLCNQYDWSASAYFL